MVENGPSRSVTVTFPRDAPAGGLTLMKVAWIDGQVADLNFLSGVSHALPVRRSRHRHGYYATDRRPWPPVR